MRPIVLIPGVGGSILVDKRQPTRKIMRQEMLHNRWLNIYPFIPRSIEQWRQDMECVVVRGKDGKISGVKSVTDYISPYDIGGTKGIKDMLPEFLLLPDAIQDVMQNSFQFRYFHDLCESLYTIGYQDHTSLFGIPYDFRLVLDPEYRTCMFRSMQETVEKARASMDKPCIVATHSLGSLMFKWFLSKHVSPEWIKDHIHKLYLMSPPFGGSLFSLKTVLVGDFYIPHFHHLYKNELQMNTGIVMCLPNEIGFSESQSLVEIDEPRKSLITLKDYERFYDQGHVSFQIWYDLYKPHLPDICSYIDVDCHVVNASNKATPSLYKLRNHGTYPHTELYSDGDGIILPLKDDVFSCMFPKNKLQITTLQDCKHTDIISHPILVSNILEDALSE